MMIFFYGVLGFVILVFVHELGHFLVARLFNITVEEFAVGMGPILLKKSFKGTLYKLCLIPLGGYCKIKGQDDFGSVDRNNDPDSFFGKSPWVRFCVVLAGPVFSFILGFVLITFSLFLKGETHLKYTYIDPPATSKYFQPKDQIISINGQKVKYWKDIINAFINNIGEPNTVTFKRDNKIMKVNNYVFDSSMKHPLESDFRRQYHEGPTIIQALEKGGSAEKNGLQFGDLIYSINSKPVRSDLNIIDIISHMQQHNINIIVHRYNNIQELMKKDPNFYKNKKYTYETVSFIVPLSNNSKYHRKVMGASLFTYPGEDFINSIEHKDISFYDSIKLGWNKSANMFVLQAKAISKLLEGNKIIFDSLSGPVKIFYTVGKASEINGFLVFLSIIGSISLALAFFNLLPFPALDGGHMLISVIEGLTKKQVPPKFLNVIQTIGIILLLSLFIFVSIRDIRDLI